MWEEPGNVLLSDISDILELCDGARRGEVWLESGVRSISSPMDVSPARLWLGCLLRCSEEENRLNTRRHRWTHGGAVRDNAADLANTWHLRLACQQVVLLCSPVKTWKIPPTIPSSSWPPPSSSSLLFLGGHHWDISDLTSIWHFKKEKK